MDKNPSTATVKTSSSNFTGDGWMNPVFGGDGTSQLTCGFVRFTPGARTNWHSPVELKEIVYQSVAYVGMARVFDYLHAVNDVLTQAGVELPLPGQSASTPQARLEYGKAVQGRIAGDDAVAARLTDTPADEVHFQRYLAANCFGDTIGRGGIDLEARELLTFSMLVALGGADAQVRGHINGNLRVGNTRARLLAVLTVLVPFIGYPRTLNGLAALNDITRS